MSNEVKHIPVRNIPEGQEGPHGTAHPTTQPAIWSKGGRPAGSPSTSPPCDAV